MSTAKTSTNSVAILSIVYFTKTKSEAALATSDGKITQKGIRNRVYRVCGWTIIACIAGIVISFSIDSVREALGDFPIVFALETIAVEAFGLAWITKGETLWPDGESYLVRLFKSLRP